MPWPLLKWIMYTSSSSSSSDDNEDDFSDAKDEGTSSKKGNDHRRDPQKQREQKHDEDSDEEDFSYDPQEEETSNDSSDTTFTINEQRRKRRRIDNKETSPIGFKRCKRVWSKEDELELLKNFLDYRTRPRTVDETPSFHNEVNPKFKLQFTKRRLAEKLGRLKKKYKNAVHKMVNNKGQEFRFRNPHDRMIFDISHRIWADGSLIYYNVLEKNVVVESHDAGSSKTSFDGKHNHGDHEGNTDVRGMIIKLAENPIPLSLSNSGGRGGDVADEKWKEQQILELEAYSKRLELVQQQVKAALDDLRSK